MTKNDVPWLRHGDKTGGYIRRSVTCRSSLCSDDGISSLWDICKQSLTEKKDNKETHNIHDTNVFQSLCSRMAFTAAAAAFNINELILLKVGALGSSFPSFWWTFSPNVIKQLGVSAVFWKYCLNNRSGVDSYTSIRLTHLTEDALLFFPLASPSLRPWQWFVCDCVGLSVCVFFQNHQDLTVMYCYSQLTVC